MLERAGWRGRRALWLTVLLVAVSLSAVACGSGGTASGNDAFSGSVLGGGAFDLSSYAGKPVVVNFWASWCGYCREEMPALVDFAAAHPEVTIIGVAVNDNEAEAERMIADFGIPFPTVWDPKGEIFARFESQGLPTTVFYTAGLQIAHTIVGVTDRAGFEAGLQQAQ